VLRKVACLPFCTGYSSEAWILLPFNDDYFVFFFRLSFTYENILLGILDQGKNVEA
jgi:hypothetical protein